MKTSIRLFVLVLALALVATACSSSGEDLGEIRVGVENDYIPFNYIDPDSSTAVGFDYDIFEEICDRIGCTPVMVEAGWPAVLVETSDGVYDVAADGISITDERKATLDFSDPYMVTIQKLMVRSDESRFGNLQEFLDGDYRLGTQVGTTNFELGEELLGGIDRIDAYDRFPIAVEGLLAGDVDAMIIDDVAGSGYLGVNADKLRLLPDELLSDPLGFAFPKGSELTAKINGAIADMKEDGTMDDLITRWFLEFEG